MNLTFPSQTTGPTLVMAALSVSTAILLADRVIVPARATASVPAGTSTAVDRSAATPATDPRETVAVLIEEIQKLPNTMQPQPSPAENLWGRIDRLAREDTQVRRDLLDRYGKTNDPYLRQRLKVALGIRHPDVIAAALRLAASADPNQRRQGFELLQGPNSEAPAVRAAVKVRLQEERDPQALAMAIGLLAPQQALPPRQEASEIVELVKGYTTHAEPQLRAASLAALVRWDKSGSSEAVFVKGLSDADQRVRQTAMGAILVSEARSESAKAGLMRVLRDPNEDAQIKQYVLSVLSHFRLSTQEYDAAEAIQTQLTQLINTAGPGFRGTHK